MALPSLATSLSFLENPTPFMLGQQKVITTISGKQYERLQFDSKLYKHLSKKLGDTAWAEKIWKSYEKIWLSIKDKETAESIEKWLHKNCLHLGCARMPFIQKMKESLPSSVHALWDAFISAISCHEHLHDEKKNDKQKIVILTNQLGEKRVSDAIGAYLIKTGLDVSIVDVEEIERPHDPFTIYSRLSEPEIHTLVNVKQDNKQLASTLWYCCEIVKKFIPDNTISAVVEKVKALQPTLILSTRWTAPNEAAIASRLQIPMKLIHCDFGFSPHFDESFRAASLLQFYTPADGIANLPANPRPDEIQLLGYPIREGLEKTTSIEEIAALKKKWALPVDDKVILMMMGSEGASKKKLLDIISAILSHATKLPSLQIAVVCGNNVEMKQEISKLLTTFSTDLPVKFHLFGWIGATEISDLYNMAHLYIGKTGGATTAELLHMGVPALGFAEYAPEENNLQYLINAGIAKKLETGRSTDQILELLALPKETHPSGSKKEPIDWKKQVTRLIKKEL